jgi:glucitol operon activator protein
VDYLHWLALLGAAWILQLALSFEQMRRFRARLVELRRLGRAAVGVGGSKYRGRAYAVVVANGEGRVVRAEIMSGFSVFARLKEVPEVRGWEVSTLAVAPPELGEKKVKALKAAASTLQTTTRTASRTALRSE